MNDYRTYKELYKYTGFFTILVAVLVLSFKVSSWLMWTHQFINANI